MLFGSKMFSVQNQHFGWFTSLAMVPSVVWLLSAFCSSQVKLYCSISGNYAHNESSQKYKQDMNRKNKLHFNGNCASLISNRKHNSPVNINLPFILTRFTVNLATNNTNKCKQNKRAKSKTSVFAKNGIWLTFSVVLNFLLLGWTPWVGFQNERLMCFHNR